MSGLLSPENLQVNPINKFIWKLGYQKGKLCKKKELFSTQQFVNDLPTNMSSFANTTI